MIAPRSRQPNSRETPFRRAGIGVYTIGQIRYRLADLTLLLTLGLHGRMSTTSPLALGHNVSECRSALPPLTVPPTDHDLTVIIPAYNEEKRLPWTLAQLAVFLSEWGIDYRILVVDDGSTDRTAALTRRLGSALFHLAFDAPGRQGASGAERHARATGRVLAFTDADLPFKLTALRQGYQWIDRDACQVVFGAATSRARKFGPPPPAPSHGYLHVS